MRALVLGGGGIAGIAWETGVLYGLGPAALDVDMILGTSAGSAVAAALTSGITLEVAFARQTAASGFESAGGGPSVEKLLSVFASVQGMPPAEARRKLGELARSAETISEEEWKQRLSAGLPSHSWPEQRIATTAVDVETGEVRVFDRDSGADLLSAVAASCAVPGIYPPVTIDGRLYMDGGVRTSTNADLVKEYDEILVIAPIPDTLRLPNAKVITPNEASMAAMTANPLNPATRVPSAHAGFAQVRQ